ncbi:MAG: helix-turn-helix transcriptional regulator [Bacteroidales bacterium]|nr:helix-turn-helix transcriptional regulator [Bacteroidales bacterium]
MEELGYLLKKRRQELGLSQKELADLAEVGLNTIVAIERGKGNPSLKVLNRLFDTLGLEVSIKPRRIY